MHVSVTMLDPECRRELGTYVTQAESLFTAVREAWEFFHNAHWQGAKPIPETMFRVRPFNDEKAWFVRADKALAKTVSAPEAEQSCLFDASPDAF